MSRLRNSAIDEDDETGIDISPLIDCIFILLIFFIVTTTFVEEDGLEVTKPEPSAALSSEEESTSVVFEVLAGGDVLYNGSSIGVRGVRANVERALRASNDPEEVPVIVQADRTAPAGLVVQVVGEARLAGAVLVNIDTKRG